MNKRDYSKMLELYENYENLLKDINKNLAKLSFSYLDYSKKFKGNKILLKEIAEINSKTIREKTKFTQNLEDVLSEGKIKIPSHNASQYIEIKPKKGKEHLIILIYHHLPYLKQIKEPHGLSVFEIELPQRKEKELKRIFELAKENIKIKKEVEKNLERIKKALKLSF